ncbi:Uncharacterized protein DAT39_008950 [Clarias magur]|uniref:Uncharacterized protein n=1 Tax=Clarias magur TaxID=1594786 RepID=A0A8J4X3U0_CLAMG|nr:Uncharacterized protein DAT39_008950 [Clarias magur]
MSLRRCGWSGADVTPGSGFTAAVGTASGSEGTGEEGPSVGHVSRSGAHSVHGASDVSGILCDARRDSLFRIDGANLRTELMESRDRRRILIV